MLVRIDASVLKQTKWHEYAVRFMLGGLITAAAGAVAKTYGPTLGGLFLAFPAVLPASATLIAKHEREKKAHKGLRGERRGINAAAVDAAGAAMGSIGLVAFACANWWLLPTHSPALVLTAGTAAWALGAGLVWAIRKHRHRRLFAA